VKTTARLLITAAFISFSVFACVYLDLLLYARHSAASKANPLVVEISPGQGFRQTAELLFKKKIINNPTKFKLFARIKSYDKKIKAGEYVLSSAMSPLTILTILESGRVQLHKLTVPEGYNINQIAAIIEKAGFAPRKVFLKHARNATFARAMGIDADTFEGYLFPDTYFFPKDTPPEKIITAMWRRFESIYSPEFQKQSNALKFSIHQVITLASVIEKETGTPLERPLISSVFHNRIKRRMRLESDPTVIYGLKNFNGNLKRKHLRTLTPYNTYMIRGLPPGPIANPGLKSIEAALFPKETGYLYFVSKKDKTHQFSSNLIDHNKAVRKYQLHR